jgi:hypothetical protein
MKTLKFAWYFITNRSFRTWLQYTLKYALIANESTRGSGASDVVFFKALFAEKVFTPEFMKNVALESETFKPVTRETFNRLDR